jgi:hypothetical protein
MELPVLNWIKSLFGSMDRTAVAQERTAKASEDIADMMEMARDQFRARLGIEAPAPMVVTPLPAKAEVEAEGSGKKKGREKV